MNKSKLVSYFDHISPGNEQKKRMKQAVLSKIEGVESSVKPKRKSKVVQISIFAASLAFVWLLIISLPLNGASVAHGIHIIDSNDSFITLKENNGQTNKISTVSEVNARPDLEFFIDGENIATIEIETNTEYISAHDWTKTQHEKYWGIEYFQTFDEEKQIAIADYDLIYDKKLTMNFDEDFTNYGQIWFRWEAWNMLQWASEADFAHFLGYGIKLEDLNDEERLKLASGEGSGIGHIQLDEYPDELQEDTIKIKITDHDGNETNQTIQVKVHNNELKQTVVSATLVE